MLPACRKLYPANDFYYIHDKAWSHISKTVRLLENWSWTSLRYQEPMAFLLPRLKFAWIFLLDPGEKERYEWKLTSFKNLDELNRKITSVWRSCCDLLTIRRAIPLLRGRSKAVIEAHCLPIEKIFWYIYHQYWEGL